MCVEDPVAVKDNVSKSSVMFKDKTIAEICDNLNLKSRESKFAQRVTRITKTCFFKQADFSFYTGLY